MYDVWSTKFWSQDTNDNMGKYGEESTKSQNEQLVQTRTRRRLWIGLVFGILDGSGSSRGVGVVDVVGFDNVNTGNMSGAVLTEGIICFPMR